MSLTSAEAAEARRKAATTLGHYNVKAGPTAWYLTGGLDIDYSDNIRYETSAFAKSDFLIKPRFDVQMIWPVTEQNSLNLRLGAGYNFYATYSEYDRYFITPGTELAFDLYVGKVWLSFHDRVSITEDTYQDPTVVGVADLSRLYNELGFTAVWDLNKLIARFGYDHANYVNLGDVQGYYPDGQADMFFTSLGYLIQPRMTAGLEAGASVVSYDQSSFSTFTEAFQWSTGVFFESQISQYMKGRASAGYSMMIPLEGPADGDDESGFYAQLGLTHRLNQYLDYVLNASKEVTFAFYGGSVDLYTVQMFMNWHIMKDTLIDTRFLYEHGTRLYSYSEVFDRYGPSIGFNRRITRHLLAGLRYTYYNRSSSTGWDYAANIISLNLRYRF